MAEYYSRKDAEAVAFGVAYGMKEYYNQFNAMDYRLRSSAEQCHLISLMGECANDFMCGESRETVKKLNAKGFEQYYNIMRSLAEKLNLRERALFEYRELVTEENLEKALKDARTVSDKIEILEGFQVEELQNLSRECRRKTIQDIHLDGSVDVEEKKKQTDKLYDSLRIAENGEREPEYLKIGDNIKGPKSIAAFYLELGKIARGDTYVAKAVVVTKKEVKTTKTETGEEIKTEEETKIELNPDTFCNLFVYSMIKEHFDKETVDKVFPGGCQQANKLYDSFEKIAREDKGLEELKVDITDEKSILKSLEDIQKMADGGMLILVVFKAAGHGHIAFVGCRGMTMSTATPSGAIKDYSANKTYEHKTGYELSKDKVLKKFLPVIVHAGTYSGVTSIALATNDWKTPTTRENLLRKSIRFYKVRKR
jgi:hypothetical protein